MGVLGIDVYRREFPKDSGYQIIKGKNCEILILKLEMLKNCYRQAFHEFLNIDDFKLITANTAAQKAYYPVYKNFLKEVNMPRQYVDKIYGTKYMRHFYSHKEIESLSKHWHKN